MRRWIGLLVVVGMFAVACGDSGTDVTSTASPPTTADSGPAALTTTMEAMAMPSPISFVTADGITLEGNKYASTADWVVLAHMRPADMTSWSDHALTMANNGYTALTFNFRGYGNSGGSGFDVGTDVIAAIDFAVAEGAERVFVIGASMGGTGALVAAAQRDVAGVVTLSAPDRFEGTNAASAIPSITAPKLFIAGDADANYADIAQSFFDASAEPKQTHIFQSGEHGTNLFQSDGAALNQLLLDFLDGAQTAA